MGGGAVHETSDELARLQRLLDDSYAAAGPHLRDIHPAKVRLTAAEVVDALPWMQVFDVATVTADGRPVTGPVDMFLLHSQLYFGTAERAVRTRHLRARSVASATLVHGEGLVVTVHGDAPEVTLDDQPALVLHLRAHYGDEWQDWGGSAPYFRIDATRMFAADMTRHHA